MTDFFQTHWVEITGAVTGLIYLYFEYKANIKMWPAGIIMSLFYTYVFIEAKFYAFACINIYYILAAIYGWIKWYNNKSSEKDEYGILHTPKKYYWGIFAATIVVFVFISYILKNYTDSPVPYGDSFVTTLSIIAMWMLAQKFVEQWLFVIVLNTVSVGLYFWQGLYPTSLMYLVYAVVSCFGYFKWKKLIYHRQ